jgi:cytochrome P450
VSYNPFDADQVDHDEGVLTELRQSCPVAQVMPGVFYLARHDDVVAVSRDTQTFKQAPFRPLDEDTRTSEELQLGESNPPGHTKIRKVLQSVLSPPRIRAMEPIVDSVCEDLASSLAARLSSEGKADMIADVGRPLPQAVIGYLTGVPEDLRPLLHDYSDDVVTFVQSPDGPERSAAAERVEKFDARLREVIAERRAQGGAAGGQHPDDAMTALIGYRDEEGLPLSDDKILLHLSKDLITGGIDTTTHLVGNMFYDLLRTPGAYEQVRADRSLVPMAVEESLRYRTIVNTVFRTSTVDTEISGVAVPKDSVVILGYRSANWDESVFECPDQFDLTRGDEGRRHLGFGWGIHLCVGAPLARVEGAHILNSVLDHVPAMRLAPSFSYERVRFPMMRGPLHLDVEAVAT